MTREEIIEQLDSIVDTYEILLGHGVNSDILDVDDIEAIKEAISALSENKGDLISRQAVLELTEHLEADFANSFDPHTLAEIYRRVKELPSVENKGEWIPVSERLPKENTRVLITTKDEFVWADDYFIYGFDDFKDQVIAWQPLPEPYKVERR